VTNQNTKTTDPAVNREGVNSSGSSNSVFPGANGLAVGHVSAPRIIPSRRQSPNSGPRTLPREEVGRSSPACETEKDIRGPALPSVGQCESGTRPVEEAQRNLNERCAVSANGLTASKKYDPTDGSADPRIGKKEKLLVRCASARTARCLITSLCPLAKKDGKLSSFMQVLTGNVNPTSQPS